MECVIIQKRNLITLEISPLLPQGTKPDPVFVLVCIFCINLVMIWRGKKKKGSWNTRMSFPFSGIPTLGKISSVWSCGVMAPSKQRCQRHNGPTSTPETVAL